MPTDLWLKALQKGINRVYISVVGLQMVSNFFLLKYVFAKILLSGEHGFLLFKKKSEEKHMSKPNSPPWWNNHFESGMWEASWIMSHENWFSWAQRMISLFVSHHQTREPTSPEGTAETWTDKLLTALASPAALWVGTWQGQVKAVRVQVHVALCDRMALRKGKSGRLQVPMSWCLTVYSFFPLFLLSFPSKGAPLEVRVCAPGTGM